MSDPFQDFDEERSSSPVEAQAQEGESQSGQPQGGRPQGGGNRSYAEEIASEKILAKYRTFYIDLKQSVNGKFVKVTEKNHGRRNTIMFDIEDLPAMIEALQKIQESV